MDVCFSLWLIFLWLVRILPGFPLWMVTYLLPASVAVKSLLDSIAILTPKKTRPFLRLTGSVTPMVDIIVTTCNEDLDICLDTIRAVLNIDYPSSKFRVIVSDDGASSELKQVVEAIAENADGAQLFYTSRVKGRDDRHKAGNLNHALRVASKLPGGASPFVAGFDADMIPERHFLRASIPHLLKDAKLGFTCPAAVSITFRGFDMILTILMNRRTIIMPSMILYYNPKQSSINSRSVLETELIVPGNTISDRKSETLLI